MKNKVCIINYGVGNLLCLKRSIEYFNIDVKVVDSNIDLSQFTHLILPGVGSFGTAMNFLSNSGLYDTIKEAVIHKKIKLMGICLGMQILFQESEESDNVVGLGVFKGKNINLSKEKNFKNQRIPHINWQSIFNTKRQEWENTILNEINEKDSFYFLHSFFVRTSQKEIIIAETDYNKIIIPSVLNYQNITACQFHPEKSGKSGLKIIKNFLQN